MTCIIGLEHEGTLFMAGDSMAMNDYYESATTRMRKVFKLGPFLIGYTWSFRMGQLLRYHLDVPTRQAEITDEAYLVSRFIPAVRSVLSDQGYTRIEDHREEGGQFLVGYNRRLYYIGSDFQVNSYDSGIAAVGAGAPYALGAMLARPEIEPVDRLLTALQIAAQCCAAVRKPFYIEVQE